MKTILLSIKDSDAATVDASTLRLDELAKKTIDEIARQTIRSADGDLELGDVFRVERSSNDSAEPSLIVRGDCRAVHKLGHQHRLGHIRVEGNIGDCCGSCMTGGTITVNGNAADYLAAPTGTRNVGMNGGLLVVTGNVGDHAGHRMRRGEIRINGNAGNSIAAWQIAGTILVSGTVGEHPAYGMRRGTLVLRTPVQLPANRFSVPLPLDSPFQHLMLNRPGLRPNLASLSPTNARLTWWVSRGDRAINGIGEVWHVRD
ncbi:formylmethanofuran dehydrogenase subunit C [Aporhodopirellula aestuarii]|uniref:Formylmethanofuran dehydrogenase subunit C n=1 Tax=Aporhodopirellula aestuarii TaxID=2950107 RepID=A0ABT0U8N2_9BACT|nr:formylmethanofuran dehydrogenase subunit C [Aporhodopirellula aestuarii]MCM2373248.1 formylmethanofuran dehydrogenase subunit C [Aporhodopirellula aestuarii]